MAQLPKNRDDTHRNLTSAGSYVSIQERGFLSLQLGLEAHTRDKVPLVFHKRVKTTGGEF